MALARIGPRRGERRQRRRIGEPPPARGCATTACRPMPTRKTISAWPKLIPGICGPVRRNPKCAPGARSIMLFGPGMTGVAQAKPARAARRSGVMRVILRRTARLRVANAPALPQVLPCVRKIDAVGART
jgi:hypothetical protein